MGEQEITFWGGRNLSCEEKEKRFVKRDGVGGEFLGHQIFWGNMNQLCARLFFFFTLYVSCSVCLVWCVLCLGSITCVVSICLPPLVLSRTPSLTSSCVSAFFLCASTTNTNSVATAASSSAAFLCVFSLLFVVSSFCWYLSHSLRNVSTEVRDNKQSTIVDAKQRRRDLRLEVSLLHLLHMRAAYRLHIFS